MQTQSTKDNRYPNATQNTKHEGWQISKCNTKHKARRMIDIQMQTQNATHEGWQISKCNTKHEGWHIQMQTQNTTHEGWQIYKCNTKHKVRRMTDVQMQTQNQTPSGSTSSTGSFYWYKTIRPILSAFAKLLKATISFVISFHPSVYLSAWNNSALTARIFMKFCTWIFFETLSRKSKFH